jgi:hypothetical protein
MRVRDMKKISILFVVGCTIGGSVCGMHPCKRFVTVCFSAGKSQTYSKKTKIVEELRQLPQNFSLQELEKFHAHPSPDDAKLLFLKTRGYEKAVKKLINEEFHRCRESGIVPSPMLYDLHNLLYPTLQHMEKRFQNSTCYIDCGCEAFCKESHDRNESED